MIPATSAYQTALAAFKSGKIVYRIEIEGYARVFTNYTDGLTAPWIESIDDLSVTINDMDGGADQSELSFTVQDQGGAITGDFPGFVFEGKKVTLKTGFVGLATADYMTLFTGFIDTVASANANLSYVFTAGDVSAKLAQVVYTAGDDGATTSGDHRKTLNGHPLDLLLDILSNEIINADGSIGLDPTLIDTARIEAYRDGPFAGMQFLFHLDQAPTADEFVKNQLLKPMGGYLWVTAEGKLTVNFFYPLEGQSAVATFGPGVWLSIPEAEQTDMVNTVQFQFDKDDSTGDSSGNYNSQDVLEYAPSVSRYGLYGEQVIQADGMRSAFQGFYISKIVARMIFMRYGLKNLKFDSAAPEAVWKMVRLEPGDVVAVTHAKVPDRAAGTMGVTGKLFEILNRTVNFTEGKVTLTMLDAGYLSNFGFYLIAPDSEDDYTVASSTDQGKYMFLAGDDGEYSNADPGNGLG